MNRTSTLLYRLAFGVIAFFAISIGLYPILYYVADMSQGFFSQKTADILASTTWQVAFYTHITFGGISLLTGWSQFSKTIRDRRLGLHRMLGKIYVISVALSGLAGLYMAFYATGGMIPQFGFGILALLWLYTTYMAYSAILRKAIDSHENWMYRSFALTLAAVTLRLWMPVLIALFGMDPDQAYILVSWLCWVPNISLAEILIRK